MMRFLSLISILLFSLYSNAVPVDMSDPNQVLHSVSTNTFSRLQAEETHLQKEPDYIKVVIEEELLPFFDYKYAAYKVLGSHLKKTTKSQRNDFINVFRVHLINVYGHILFEYKKQKFDILDNNNFKNKKIVSINVIVRGENDQLTHFVFKLKKNSKTKEWKVFDVIAEGISMLHSKQSEFGELIQKKGIDSVIDLLKTKNSEFSS